MASKIRLGKAVKVQNKNRRKFSNADTEYTAVLVKMDGAVKALLLTDGEVNAAITRAARNPEDCPKQSFISKILD